MPNTIKKVGYLAFDRCESLTQVIVEGSPIIEGYAFDHCQNLKTVEFLQKDGWELYHFDKDEHVSQVEVFNSSQNAQKLVKEYRWLNRKMKL